MAKIAGRKNEAAWQAGNNFIATLSPDDQADMGQAMEQITTLVSALAAITVAYATTGIPLPSVLLTITSWVSEMMITGIPLDVWIGKASYDLYSKGEDDEGKTVYKPEMGPALAKAAHDVRQFVKSWQFGKRQQRWLSQDTPPIPHAVRLAAVKKEKRADPAKYHAARRVAYHEARAAKAAPVALAPAAKAKK